MLQILQFLSRLPAAAKAIAGLALLAGAGLLYVSMVAPRNLATASACPATGTVSARMSAAATGEVAAFQAFATPRPLPVLGFLDASGAATTLDARKGKIVLLNLWATWCVPCRKEMPALDALQAAYGGPAFEVVAVNIDTRNVDKPRQWLTDNNIRQLAYYADPEAKIFQELKRVGQAVGMPTTLLIDARGCQLGVLHGPAEWASEDGRKLIEAAMGRPA